MVRKVGDANVPKGSGDYEKKYTGKNLPTIKDAHDFAIKAFEKCGKTFLSVGALGARNKTQHPPRFEKEVEREENDFPSIRPNRRIH